MYAFSACVQFSAFGNRIQFPHSVIKHVLPALIVGGFLIALIVDWFHSVRLFNLMPNQKFLLYMQISRKYEVGIQQHFQVSDDKVITSKFFKYNETQNKTDEDQRIEEDAQEMQKKNVEMSANAGPVEENVVVEELTLSSKVSFPCFQNVQITNWNNFSLMVDSFNL